MTDSNSIRFIMSRRVSYLLVTHTVLCHLVTLFTKRRFLQTLANAVFVDFFEDKKISHA
jgi:hypothetical protein